MVMGRTAKMQKKNNDGYDGSIDSDGNFHNDDSIITVEDIMMIPTISVDVTGVKCTICQSSEGRCNITVITNKQGGVGTE